MSTENKLAISAFDSVPNDVLLWDDLDSIWFLFGFTFVFHFSLFFIFHCFCVFTSRSRSLLSCSCIECTQIILALISLVLEPTVSVPLCLHFHLPVSLEKGWPRFSRTRRSCCDRSGVFQICSFWGPWFPILLALLVAKEKWLQQEDSKVSNKGKHFEKH